jgi:HK97 family phage major capsid protein
MRSNILKQPKMTSTGRATYAGETQAIPVTQQGFGQAQLQAHKLTAMTPISRELIVDSDPSVEMTVKDDLGEQLSLGEDLGFLMGVASPLAPQGILTAPGTTQQAAVGTNGDPLSYEMIVDLRTQLNRKNVPTINRFWVCSPDITGEIAKVQSPAHNYVFVENAFSIPNSVVQNNQPGNRKAPVGVLMGWPVFESSQIQNGTTGTNTTGLLGLVEGSEVRIGQRGEILLDASKEGTYVDAFGTVQSAYQNDEILYRAILRHDILLRHAEAVAVRSGIIINSLS